MSVIGVGNIVAGGVGKTEVVAEVARGLAQRTGRPIIICLRGYGSPERVPDDGILLKPGERLPASQVGDEALVHREKNPDAFILIGAARARILRHHWEQSLRRDLKGLSSHLPIVLLDDALQHESLKKDVEIAVHDFSVKNPIFREFMTFLSRKNLVRVSFSTIPAEWSHLDWFEVQYQCTKNPGSVFSPAARPAFLFCALGNPSRVKSFLERQGVAVVGECFFPDHHFYDQGDWDALMARFKEMQSSFPGLKMITTLKDAVKLPHAWREEMAQHLEVLQISVNFVDDQAKDSFYEKIIAGCSRVSQSNEP